jgi:hypothetical protein
MVQRPTANRPTAFGRSVDIPWVWLGLDTVDGTQRLYFGRSLIAVHMRDDIPQDCSLLPSTTVTRLSDLWLQRRTRLLRSPASNTGFQTEITRLESAASRAIDEALA